MNWKEEATEKLRHYDAMRTALTNIPEELERLEQEARAIRSVQTDKVHVKSTGNREDALINNLVRRHELAQNYQQAQSWLRTTDRALNTLAPDDRLVLQRLFITKERDSLSRLCSELGVEQSSIYRKRDKALHRFTMALYGVDN